MILQSRFSSSEAVDFEFHRSEDEPSINKRTLFVSHIETNFGTAPTTRGNVQVFISDAEGEDLIWESEAQSKTHLSFAPKIHVPVPNDAKLILRYANEDSVEFTSRFLWQL